MSFVSYWPTNRSSNLDYSRIVTVCHLLETFIFHKCPSSTQTLILRSCGQHKPHLKSTQSNTFGRLQPLPPPPQSRLCLFYLRVLRDASVLTCCKSHLCCLFFACSNSLSPFELKVAPFNLPFQLAFIQFSKSLPGFLLRKQTFKLLCVSGCR